MYLSLPAVDSKEDFKREFYNGVFDTMSGDCLYAILDKSIKPEGDSTLRGFAGVVSLSGTNLRDATTEMGAIIFPSFQRSGIGINAIGILLLHALDPPSKHGLGLRRVEWRTHASNTASRGLALRMGFEFEGIARWHRVSPDTGCGLPVDALERRNGTHGELPGRHTATYSIVWDEWEEKRQKIVSLMSPRA